LRTISISALVILVLAAIAALAQEPADSIRHTEFPPNGYIGLAGVPAPSALAQEKKNGTRADVAWVPLFALW
jgi:hypothetical protein